jgi:molybdopterin-guanine dinucleotide biosynthesis protein B
VLVEGYKHAACPKLEVWRAANERPWLHLGDANFIAVAADQNPPGDIRHFSIDDLPAITAFVLEYTQ